IHGQENPNGRSLPHFALDFDVPLVAVHDAVGYAHSESVTLHTLSGEKWVEYTAADFLGHATPRIGYRSHDPVFLCPRTNVQATSGGHDIQGVEDDVGQDLDEFGALACDGEHLVELRGYCVLNAVDMGAGFPASSRHR